MAHRRELRSIDPGSSAIRRLGDTLYNLRVQAGLTQLQLAVRTGGRWSRSHIGRVENGDVTPSPDFVEAMDRLLDGGHSLVRCLPPLLLETAKHRSRRQRLRREPDAAVPHSTGQNPERLDRSALHASPATTTHNPANPSSAAVPLPTPPVPGRPPPVPSPSSAAVPLATPPVPGRPPPVPSEPRPNPHADPIPQLAPIPPADLPAPSPWWPAPNPPADPPARFDPGQPPRHLTARRFDGSSPPDPGRPSPSRGDATTPTAVPFDQESRSSANRSDLLGVSMWTGLGAALESVRLTLRVEGPAGGPVSHEQLELAVVQYARAYWSTPAGALFGQVRQCRQVVDGMLDQHQAAASRQHLHLVAGWLSALLGNLSFHLSDFSSARMHLGTAGRLGQEAGHNGLVAWVRGAQSMVELHDDRPEEALRLAREGQALAPNPLVRAQLASWGEARVLARMGERRGVLDAIVRGGHAVDSSDHDHSPGGVFSFSVSEFEQYCGTACLWLDLPEEAKRHADQAHRLRDTVAAKALARLDPASAEGQLGRPAEVSEIGAEVLQMPAEYLIDPIVRRATELAASLRQHGSVADVRDFHERLAALIAASGEPRAARSGAER